MSDQGHIGTNLAIWGVVFAAAVTLLVAFMPHWAAWVSALLWLLVCWPSAILGLSDGPSRAFLAGTLRKSSYTQIYTTLTRRNVMWVWRRLCDAAGDRDGWPTLFRAALTWRLYDTALLLAVAYPLLLLVGQWIVTGEEGRLGGVAMLPAAAFWPERAAMLGVFAIIIPGFVAGKLALASRHRVVRRAGYWLLPLAVAVAFAVAVAVAVAGLGAVVGAVVGALSFALIGALGGARGLALAGPIGLFLAVLAVVVADAAGLAPAGARGGIAAVALAGLVAVDMLDYRGRPVLARWIVTAMIVLSVIGWALFLDWSAIPEDRRSVFLFLAVFPLINALFDVLSYAVTLSLLRRGLRAAWPFLWGVLDLVIACVLFLGLGIALVAAIHALNRLAGVPLLDLGALFAGVKDTPGQYVWLYLMLFSTIVPTALHVLVSLLGVQGLWPRRLRRPVAGWIDRAPDSPLHAVRAAAALGLIWTIPLILLGAVPWLLWIIGGDLVRGVLGLYFDLLLWIAAVPVGAF